MKKQLIVLLLISTTLIGYTQSYKNALGVRFGSSSSIGGAAISYKHFIKPNTAIEVMGAIGNNFSVGALYQLYEPLGTTQNLQWYYGAGGYIVLSQPKGGIGAAGVIGIDYKFDEAPINISLDFKPELSFAPSVGLNFNTFAFAIRYTF
jgi:hypothetical protein